MLCHFHAAASASLVLCSARLRASPWRRLRPALCSPSRQPPHFSLSRRLGFSELTRDAPDLNEQLSTPALAAFRRSSLNFGRVFSLLTRPPRLAAPVGGGNFATWFDPPMRQWRPEAFNRKCRPAFDCSGTAKVAQSLALAPFAVQGISSASAFQTVF